MQSSLFRRGFTLIEMLVVITIIGILSSILYSNFIDARQDAKNKAFRSELKEAQLALEVYRSQNNVYPSALTDLVPEFITELPQTSGSANAACAFTYTTGASDTWYKLTAANCFAGATDATEGVQEDDVLARCPSGCSTCAGVTFDTSYKSSSAFYETFAIYSFGGQCE